MIYQHLGLGDHIVLNGLTRKVAEDNPGHEVHVPSKSHNYANVRHMFRDNPRIVVVDAIDDAGMDRLLLSGDFDRYVSSHLGNPGNAYPYSSHYDDAFYLTAGVDPMIKHEYFHVQRDHGLEGRTFEELVTSRGIAEYTFIHEKDSAVIDRDLLDGRLPVVTADPKYGFFSMLKVIENAKSVNLVSSSFLSLLMCKRYNQNVIAHMYADAERRDFAPYIMKHNIRVIL